MEQRRAGRRTVRPRSRPDGVYEPHQERHQQPCHDGDVEAVATTIYRESVASLLFSEVIPNQNKRRREFLWVALDPFRYVGRRKPFSSLNFFGMQCERPF